MSIAIIIALCTLLLLAYVFDITSSYTRIPSVVLLLALGWVSNELARALEFTLPDFSVLLPVFGTIGLILIVLEGSLDLTVNRSKLGVMRKAMISAIVPMLGLTVMLAFAFQQYSGCDFKTAMINAIPFGVISSAIAIPSARALSPDDREFVVYESSLSDILGVLLFNFLVFNEIINGKAFGNFSIQLLLIIIISFVAVASLAWLLSRIKHHVSYTPIILLVLLIYALSKVLHLPGLLFIMVFGLFLGNLDELQGYRWIQKLHPEQLEKAVHKFKEITAEATFLIRALFFILFGFLMDTQALLNTSTLPFAVAISVGVLLIRWLILKLAKLPVMPLLFIAPRGLITILLFLSIPVMHVITIVNTSLVIQSILISVLIMMLGLMIMKKEGSTSAEVNP
jgi:cell volume regulation protein A